MLSAKRKLPQTCPDSDPSVFLVDFYTPYR
jgi:hypothetical protein